jgi:NAD(P)H dehydrogenase (quinone)
MYAIAGASGQLGKLALAELIARVGAANVVALARDPAKLADFAAQGVTVRVADYTQPETLASALVGVERLLLISGNAVGQRVPQHKAVIVAAAAAGVGLIAYTSVLHADISTIGLAEEHRQTEAALKAGGVPFVLLRNGWYNENYTGALAPSIAHGAIIGAAGNGRISSASRADYAAAAAGALVSAKGGEVYELAGDASFTMAEFAVAVSAAADKPVSYVDMTKDDYAQALLSVGLPEVIANMLADSGFESSKDQLFDDGHALSLLLGRPTTPIADSIAKALS